MHNAHRRTHHPDRTGHAASSVTKYLWWSLGNRTRGSLGPEGRSPSARTHNVHGGVSADGIAALGQRPWLGDRQRQMHPETNRHDDGVVAVAPWSCCWQEASGVLRGGDARASSIARLEEGGGGGCSPASISRLGTATPLRSNSPQRGLRPMPKPGPLHHDFCIAHKES